jgi:hypothetical protein
VKIVRLLFLLLIIALFTSIGCATAKKDTFQNKRKQGSHVDASQLGRNKYYFSPNYQKKLTKSYKKK